MVMLNKSEFKLVVLRLMQNLSEELNLYSCHYFCDRLWIFHLKKSFVIQACSMNIRLSSNGTQSLNHQMENPTNMNTEMKVTQCA